MKIVDPNEMKEIERISFEDHSLSERQIIQNVGQECGEEIFNNYFENEEWEEDFYRPVLFILGKGNNAADGVAIALYLKKKNVDVYLYLAFEDEKEFSNELTYFLKKSRKQNIPEVNDLRQVIEQEDILVIDSLFGTGFKSKLPEKIESLLFLLRESDAEIISIDIPSGVDASSGKAAPFAIEAIETFSIGCPKVGHFVGEGKKLRGILTNINAGFPEELTIGGPFHPEAKGFFQLQEYVLWAELERDEYGHKGLFGHVAIVGGSFRYTGAPLLAAEAALRLGVGLVTIVAPKEVIPLIMSRCKKHEIMFLSIEEAVEKNLFDQFSSIVVGPGIGGYPNLKELFEHLFNTYKQKLVIDADGLNFLSQNSDVMGKLKSYKGPVILTPHLGEMARQMDNCTVEELEHLKGIEKVKNFAQSLGHFVLLKSAISSFYTPKGKVFFLDGANSGLSKGGAGDILAGMIGAHLAMNSFLGVEEAVLAAVFKHHFLGMLIRSELTASSMLPSDFIDKLGSMPSF